MKVVVMLGYLLAAFYLVGLVEGQEEAMVRREPRQRSNL